MCNGESLQTEPTVRVQTLCDRAHPWLGRHDIWKSLTRWECRDGHRFEIEHEAWCEVRDGLTAMDVRHLQDRAAVHAGLMSRRRTKP